MAASGWYVKRRLQGHMLPSKTEGQRQPGMEGVYSSTHSTAAVLQEAREQRESCLADGVDKFPSGQDRMHSTTSIRAHAGVFSRAKLISSSALDTY